ncbi:alpha/beta-hydrolase [Heliocybe sulcata]|uniref:Alpha/beta-hydrolase n=1 Tax=Heliocybe sulcata TaxID=5364 RepID=A0A5C3NQQ1_9AGAM|nr:alpha/beta-hydrolase [Heliocybe sulcata]
MPYVDLCSSASGGSAADDFASVWYTTNTNFCCVSSFDPDKPCIMLLHPPALDSTWMNAQMNDPRISSNYNLIAFDMRCSGKSVSRPTGWHDAYVEAADLAFAHQSLQLPPCHIFAVGNQSVPVILRFAALFPEMCLSLTLCAVPPPTELKHVFTALEEMFQSWCYAEDLESLEHAGMEVVRFVCGNDSDMDLADELIAHWTVHYPPTRRSRTIQAMSVVMNRTPMTRREYEAIRCPVLIIQGEYSDTHPVKYGDTLKECLVNADARTYVVRGGQGFMSMVPSFANIVNQVFFKFLAARERVPSILGPPAEPIPERMRRALEDLSEFVGEPSIADRDPRSSISFSCCKAEVAQAQMDTIRNYAKGQCDAFNPLGHDGRPIRKYSERIQGHWFHGERDGLSYAGNGLSTNDRRIRDRKDTGLSVPHLLPSEPISFEAAQDSRIRRATYNPASFSVDKHVIKGSMNKVMASTGVPLPRVMQGML